MKHYLALIVLLISAATPVHPFSSGAPQAACPTLSPDADRHGAQPSMLDIPYVLNLSSFYDQVRDELVYTPNTTYEITLEPRPMTDVSNFRGFLIQPRLVADDSTVVGQFEEPPIGGDYRYSFCTNREGSVTHSSGTDKTTITIPWMSPPQGTGTIHFGYAVVQTRQVYWANQRSSDTINERPCGLPFYLDRQTNSCVKQCPIFTFGNHTTVQCQPDSGQRVQADATEYFGSIRADEPVGTVVFRFRVLIDRNGFTNNNINGIIVSLVRTGLVESIFKLSDGTTLRQFRISLFGGIDAVNASGRFPEIRLYNSRYAVYEDSVIYQGIPPQAADLEIPGIQHFDLNIIVVGDTNDDAETLTQVGRVFIDTPPDPCANNPCQNGGMCNATGSQNFTCACTPGYTGDICDVVYDPCVLDPCENSGTCRRITMTEYMCDCGNEYTGQNCETTIEYCQLLSPNCNNGSCVEDVGTFICECDPGFTGEFCDVDIDECATAGCQNGTCVDLVNGFRCMCYLGWTGELCDTDINYCASDQSQFGPCDDTGANACNDQNSTYTCSCVNGFTGYNCSEDIDDCEPNPCQNGGNCSDFFFGIFECDCPSGYSGPTCEVVSDPCGEEPCMNGGTCNDTGSGNYLCECAPGYTGRDCQNDIPDCTPVNPCQNGGTCDEQFGPGFTCMCPPGFTDPMCATVLITCQPDTCLNGGTCVDLPGGNITCNCTEGFDGERCENDLPFCQSDTCLNGGTCVEGLGTATSCNCTEGFSGPICATDEPFCQQSSCLNGGTCIEGVGTATSCNCTEGFSGERCEIDDPSCRLDSCLNGGTCVEGVGTDISCNCTEGFGGDRCQNDLPFCQDNPCFNGGTCVEGSGTQTSCNCTEGFDGERCEIDRPFCQTVSCQNGGTCIEGVGTLTTCNCTEGFEGDNCETDLPFCRSDSCLNGGTCVEGYGTATTCNCTEGFNGESCENDLPFCQLDTCLNGGTCVEGFGTETSCNCTFDFAGDNCEVALMFCMPDTCQNGGTCDDSGGLMINCTCAEGYAGMICNEDDPDYVACTSDSLVCENGGTCVETFGPNARCDCGAGFSGERCETDVPSCQPDSCLNNGTCFESIGDEVVCDCVMGFDGDRCEEDLDFCREDSCANEGVCVEGYGTQTSCNCTEGFGGDRCEIDLPFCTTNTCLNGGDCIEGTGTNTSCDCSEGFDGDRCEIDLPFCRGDSCLNGGTCMEDVGPNITCNCTEGYGGNRCEIDLPFCTDDSCLNDGDCIEGTGPATSCDCGEGFDGDRCEIDLLFCRSDSCLNGGTCIEGYGILTSCNCTEGFDGDSCENDLPFCQSDTCLNGGTCVEGFGTETSCNCTSEFAGNNCEVALMFCMPDTCQNGGTCDDSEGFMITCSCADGYTGMICNQDDPEYIACSSEFCLNGGTCVEEFGPDYRCDCPAGFTGSTCDIDLPFCQPDTCRNGTCIEGPGVETMCMCDTGYTGDACDIQIPCIPDPCENGGTCVPQPDGDQIYMCQCPPDFTGLNCEVALGCQVHDDCPSTSFCQISCPSDEYREHTSLLVEAASLTGTSFVSVPQNRYPEFGTEVSIFAVFRQEPGNRGYLLFYGTSPDHRNFAIFLDGSTTPRVYLYYTSTDGTTNTVSVQASIADGEVHYLAVTVDVNAGNARFFLDGAQLEGIKTLTNPDLTADITASNQPSLLVGARLIRHYRFIGEIMDVVVFNSLISSAFVAQLQADYDQVSNPMGLCVPYLTEGQECPAPSTAPSLLCESVSQVCDPSLRCLPTITGTYTCRPQPLACSSDSECGPEHFCGSPLPAQGQNFFENPGGALPGQVMFLQENTMGFDGSSVISLPATANPPLATDLTIFATVCQDIGNDGYVVGKGINDRMRDFGLYLRSTKRTIWLAYGADGTTPGFREILFFYNVTVADGNCHSVAAVIDSASNRAVLYIDGEAVGIRAPLPSVPEFRSYHNLLYVGGRPSTRLFRFSGRISNLFVSSGALTLGNIVTLHRQAFANGGVNPITTDTTERYCYPYQGQYEQCYVNSFSNNDFRCQPSSECVPILQSNEVNTLPESVSNDPLRLLGRCVQPCSEDCSNGAQNLQCGTDGRTYYNTCFRTCANIQLLHDGPCMDYTTLYASCNPSG